MSVNWVPFADQDFTALGTIGGAGAAASTIGPFVDIRGCWGPSGNSVRSIPVLLGGSGYSAANPPTGQTNTPSGTALRKSAATWVGVVNGSGVVTAILILTMGHGFLPAGNGTASLSSTGATITHNGGSGLTLDYANAVLTGNLVRGIANGNAETSTGLGSHNWLLGAALNMTKRQKVVWDQWLTATTDVLGGVARVDTATKFGYSVQVSTGATTAYRIWVHSNYQSGGGQTALSVTGQPALTVNRLYRTELFITAFSPSSLQIVVTDITPGSSPTVVYTSAVVTDNTAGFQAAGRAGMGLTINLNAPMARMAIYTEATIAITPDIVPIGDVVPLALERIGGTAWGGGTDFNLTGGTGASIANESVSADPYATTDLTTGSAAGALTISDGEITGTVTVSPIVAPGVTVGAVDGSSVPIVAAAAPLYAVDPLTVQYWRMGTSNGDIDTDPTAFMVDEQTGLSAGVVPDAATDTAPNGLSFYACRVIDANGQTVDGAQSWATVYGEDVIQFAAIGDSTVAGHASTGMTRQAAGLYVLTPGSGNTNVSLAISNHHGGSGAVIGGTVVEGGGLAVAWMSEYGDNYDEGTYPTVTVTADGVAPTVELVPVGGWPIALQDMLRAKYGRNVRAILAARGGSASGSWQPGSQLLRRLDLMAGNGDVTPTLLASLGYNDANSLLVDGDEWQANMAAIFDHEFSIGRRRIGILPQPFWFNGGAVKNALMQEYARRCDLLADDFGPRLKVIGKGLFDLFAAHPEYYSDGLHFTPVGSMTIAGRIVDEVAELMGLTSGEGAVVRNRYRTR